MNSPHYLNTFRLFLTTPVGMHFLSPLTLCFFVVVNGSSNLPSIIHQAYMNITNGSIKMREEYLAHVVNKYDSLIHFEVQNRTNGAMISIYLCPNGTDELCEKAREIEKELGESAGNLFNALKHSLDMYLYRVKYEFLQFTRSGNRLFPIHGYTQLTTKPWMEIRNSCSFFQKLVRNIERIELTDPLLAEDIMTEMPNHFCYFMNLIDICNEHGLLTPLAIHSLCDVIWDSFLESIPLIRRWFQKKRLLDEPPAQLITRASEVVTNNSALCYISISAIDSILNGEPLQEVIERLDYSTVKKSAVDTPAMVPQISVPQVCLDLFKTMLRHTPIESRIEHKSTLLMALYALSFPTLKVKNSKRHYLSMISGVLHRDAYQSSTSMKERQYYQMITPIFQYFHTEPILISKEQPNILRPSKIQLIFQYLKRFTEARSAWTHISRALVICNLEGGVIGDPKN